MRRRFQIVAVLFVILVLLSAVPALAQERHVSLGASVSAVTSTDRFLLGDRIDIQPRVFMPELHLTYFITDAWSVEASYGRYEATVRSKSSGVDYGRLIVSPLQLTLQYRQNYGHPPPYWDVASYYLGAGIGYFITDFRNEPTFNIKIKNSLGGHVSAGFDFFLAKDISFSMEFKYWIAQSDIESGAQKGHFDLNAYSFGGGFKLFF